jgi:chitinase
VNRYVLSFASGYDKWSLARGFDLPKLIQVVDFINIMTYDYYAAWEAPSGCITGPPAPLYGGWWFLSENVDSTMKFYACTTQQIKKLNLGIPFYGRYWNNVPNLYFDPLHRTAVSANGGNCEGNAIAWRDIPTSWNLSKNEKLY